MDGSGFLGKASSFVIKVEPYTRCQINVYGGNGQVDRLVYENSNSTNDKLFLKNIVHQNLGGMNDNITQFVLFEIITSLNWGNCPNPTTGSTWINAIVDAFSAQASDENIDVEFDDLDPKFIGGKEQYPVDDNYVNDKFVFNFDSTISLLIVSAVSVLITVVIMCCIWWCLLSKKLQTKYKDDYNKVITYNENSTDIEN